MDLFDNIVTAIIKADARSDNSIELIDSFDDLFAVAKVTDLHCRIYQD